MLHPKSLASCHSQAVERQDQAILGYTVPKPLGAVSSEWVAKNLKRIVSGIQCPPRPDYLPQSPGGADCPRRVCPVRLLVEMLAGTPESASGATGGGV